MQEPHDLTLQNLFCNVPPRTIRPAGPHLFLQLFVPDHPQVEASQRPQWQHHSLPGVLPAAAGSQRALQVRLLSEG